MAVIVKLTNCDGMYLYINILSDTIRNYYL